MRITKKVIEIGNGAAVYVPKEYSGKQVVIILPEGINAIKKRIIEKLIPHMEKIAGVYLFGSYARQESNSHSDIDILIITKEEAKELKSLFEDIDVRVITLEKLKKSIDNFPAISLPILKEAKTIINPILLEDLKNSKINYNHFKWNFDEIRRTIKLIETFIATDEEDISISHIYSLIMRARICYMIQGLLENKQFSNAGLQNNLLKIGLDKEKYNSYYEVYQKIREGEEVKGRINKEEIINFISIIKKYASKLENESKKAFRKRN